jgi:hypothetical protein
VLKSGRPDFRWAAWTSKSGFSNAKQGRGGVPPRLFLLGLAISGGGPTSHKGVEGRGNRGKGDDAMLAIEIEEHARKLMEVQGPKAIVEAAQKARTFEEQGASEQAVTWRKIEAAMRTLQGPRAK